MLGLGNKINRARVYKTFVGEVASYTIFNIGSFGEGGYIIDHLVNESLSNVTYTEVYPEKVTFYADPTDSSSATSFKKTVMDSAIYIDGNNHLVYINDDPVTEIESVEFSDYRLASPNEFDKWYSSVYLEHEENYFEGNSENPYIVVTPGFYSPWAGDVVNPFFIPQGASGFILKFTDGSEDLQPSLEEVQNGSYYVLAVRQFTSLLNIVTPTPSPSTEPEPTSPSPLPYQLRSSGDLNSSATDDVSSETDGSLDFSINADVLTSSNVNIYIYRPTKDLTVNTADERFKIQFKVAWEVTSANSFGDIPAPWNPENAEQKFVNLTFLKAGWEDKPLVDHLDNPNVGSYYTNNLDYATVNLNKAVQDDLPIGTASLGNGLWLDASVNPAKIYFGYVGYLDISNFTTGFLSSSDYADEYTTLKDFCDNVPYLPEWKRCCLFRVVDVQYGTNQRPLGDRILFPNNLRYILYPLIHRNQVGFYYDYSATNPDIADFVDTLFTGQSQNEPPIVDGENEDYYN